MELLLIGEYSLTFMASRYVTEVPIVSSGNPQSIFDDISFPLVSVLIRRKDT